MIKHENKFLLSRSTESFALLSAATSTFLLNRIIAVQECDATGVQSGISKSGT